MQSSLFCLMPNQGAGEGLGQEKEVHDGRQGYYFRQYDMCEHDYVLYVQIPNVGTSVVRRLPD